MTALRTLSATSDNLANALADLSEQVHAAQATWDTLGDASMYGFLSDEKAVEMWELDLHTAVMAEQIVTATLDTVQDQMGAMNEQWVKFLIATAA
jgi:hypothetical protein